MRGGGGGGGGGVTNKHNLSLSAKIHSTVLMVQFDLTSYSVTEGEQASLTAVLSFAADRDVTVDVSTVDGSAIGKYC